MSKIIESVEGHYEVHEGPFSRAYVWHPASVTLECECGERFTLTATSATATCCRCGTDHGTLIHDIQEREARLPDTSIHPWHHDTQEQEKQHRQDETTYTDSSWRYNDITSGVGDDKE